MTPTPLNSPRSHAMTPLSSPARGVAAHSAKGLILSVALAVLAASSTVSAGLADLASNIPVPSVVDHELEKIEAYIGLASCPSAFSGGWIGFALGLGALVGINGSLALVRRYLGWQVVTVTWHSPSEASCPTCLSGCRK